MSDNKHTRRGFNGKGYYIALILCAAAIGISGYLYYQNTAQQEQTLLLQEEEPQEELQAEPRETHALEAIATQPPAPETTVPATQPSAAPTEKKPLKTAAPVSGETLAGYAMDCLSYNETTRDWRVHNGVDIAAESGTQVCAAASGEVYTVYDDEQMGTTLVIRLEGGYTTKYSSLSEDVTVSAGDTVQMGQTIGCVGTTALMETALGDHVHFSVTKDDEAVDPAEFLALE